MFPQSVHSETSTHTAESNNTAPPIVCYLYVVYDLSGTRYTHYKAGHTETDLMLLPVWKTCPIFIDMEIQVGN